MNSRSSVAHLANSSLLSSIALEAGELKYLAISSKLAARLSPPGIEALHPLADAQAVVLSASVAAVLLIWPWTIEWFLRTS